MFKSTQSLQDTSVLWIGAGTATSTSDVWAKASYPIPVADFTEADSGVITAVLDVTTPSAGAFTAADTDVCTKTNHGFYTGLLVTVSNSGGALPAGLSAATNYYVIRATVNTFKLASSLANAIAGTAVDITDTGSGTNTVTPTTFAGTLKLQGSIDNESTWFDIPNETKTVTADGNSLWEIDYVRYPKYRVYPNVTAGYATLSVKALTR